MGQMWGDSSATPTRNCSLGETVTAQMQVVGGGVRQHVQIPLFPPFFLSAKRVPCSSPHNAEVQEYHADGMVLPM